MPKKSKSPKTAGRLTREQKAQNDFHFIVVVSVFAIVTIFGSTYFANVRQRAARQQALPVAQVDLQAPGPSLVPAGKLKDALNQKPQPQKQYLATPTPRPYGK